MNITPYVYLTKNILSANLSSSILPYKLTFAATYQCNQKCKACRIWEKEEKAELDIKQIELFFKKNNFFSWIDITGGEIFLRKDILDIFSIIFRYSSNLLLLHFPTNGFLTDAIVYAVKEIAKMKNRAPKLIITVSLDGPSDVNDSLRGTAKAFEKSVVTYKELKKIKGIEAYLGMTLSLNNFNLIEETFASVKKDIPDISFDDFHINLMNRSSHYFNNIEIKAPSNDVLYDEVKKIIRKRSLSLRPTLIIERLFLVHLIRYLESSKPPLTCEAMRSSFFLDPYGNIYPCHIFDEKAANIMEIEYSIPNLFKSESTRELRNRIKNSECPECWTPCEAYQTILSNFFNYKNLRELMRIH